MKRFIIVGALALGLAALRLPAETAVTVGVVGNSIAGTGSAEIFLDASGRESAVSFTLNWDPKVLEYISCEAGGDLPPGAQVNRNATHADQGSLVILVGLTPGTTFPARSAQSLLKVSLRAVPMTTEGTRLSFGDRPCPRRVFDVKGERLLSVTFSDREITVTPPASPH